MPTTFGTRLSSSLSKVANRYWRSERSTRHASSVGAHPPVREKHHTKLADNEVEAGIGEWQVLRVRRAEERNADRC